MLTMAQLIDYGCLSSEAADYLEACVKAGVNILISGGSNAGKSTFRAILADFAPVEKPCTNLGMIEGPGFIAALKDSTGCEGLLASIEADSPQQAIHKLIKHTATTTTPMDSLGRGFALIAQIMQLEDGSRKVMSITEAPSPDGAVTQYRDVFVYTRTGMDGDRILGKTVATGYKPDFSGCVG